MPALDEVAGWPVPHAAAAVIGPDGVLTTAGDVERRFALASVTKLLSALATLVGVEEQAVSLDDPAGPPGSTVRHLLAHASGLSPDDPEREVTKPATRRIYSNAGFEVMAAHVSEASGVPFADYVREAVIEPLLMASTTMGGSAAQGAHGTVADLAHLAAELLRPSMLAAETLTEATTVAFGGLAGVLPGYGRQDPNDWGLGFELRDAKAPHWTSTRNSPGTFGHFGRTGTFLWVDPEAGLACVALTDREFGPWAVEAWPRLSDAVLAEFRNWPAGRG